MKEAIFGPGEIIFSENEFDDRMFFIYSGEVEFFIDHPAFVNC